MREMGLAGFFRDGGGEVTFSEASEATESGMVDSRHLLAYTSVDKGVDRVTKHQTFYTRISKPSWEKN